MKRILAAVALVLVGAAAFGQAAGTAQAGPSLFSLTLTPTLAIPVGADSSVFTLGGGGSLSADLRMPFLPLLFADLTAGYTYLPLNVTAVPNGVSLVNGSLGVGVRFDPVDKLAIRALLSGGYYYGFIGGYRPAQGGGLFASAGVDASYELFPSFRLGAGASFAYYLPVAMGVTVQLGASYAFGGGGAAAAKPAVQQQQPAAKPAPLKTTTAPAATAPKDVTLGTFTFSPVFPVFYQVYSRKPVGTAVLANTTVSDATNVKVSFLVKQYMDNAKVASGPATVAAGGSESYNLLALFKKDVLGITAATTVSANITLEYTLDGKAQKKEYTEEIRVETRNSITWADESGTDDSGRAAAFVATTDPTVQMYSKNLQAQVKGRASDVINKWLLAAAAVHESLTQFGITYVVDPTTPYVATRGKAGTVDFLQFPQETLQYKAGDCDDLSILYCSLMQAVGAETAFITIPGHIYMAVSLQVTPDAARQAFSQVDNLILEGDQAWLPIEITQRQGGFMQAWADGAKQWRENKARNQAQLLPIRTAWQSYASVGFASDIAPITVPPAEKVVKAYQSSVEAFIASQIATQEAALLAEIKKASDPTKSTNRLGVLYAKNGLFDKAEVQFTKLADKEYAPALVNLGNIYYLWRKDAGKALGFYTRAQKKDPNSAGAWLGIARINNDQENYGAARTAYAEVKRLNPDMAGDFAYLDLRGDESARAADISGAKTALVWEEPK